MSDDNPDERNPEVRRVALRAQWRRFLEQLASPPVAGSLALATLVTAPYAYLVSQYEVPPPSSVEVSGLLAESYCSRVSAHASALGSLHSVAALVFGLVVLTGGFLQATQDGAGSVAARLRRPLLFASAPCAVLAGYLFLRASAANELARVANDARVSELDRPGVLTVCTKAWGAWVISRNDANGVAKAATDEAIKGRTKAIDAKATGVAVKAGDSNAAADEALAAISKVDRALSEMDAGGAVPAKHLVATATSAAKRAVDQSAAAKAEASRPIGAVWRDAGAP